MQAPQQTPVAPKAEQPPGRKRWRRWVWPIVQTAITAAILIWVLADRHLLEQMGHTLRRAELWWLVAGVALGGVWVVAAAYRWWIFLRVQNIDIPLRRATAVYLISLFFTLVLPGAASGGAVRVFYLFREHPHRKAAAILSVIMDNISGLIALVIMAIVFTFSRASWFDGSPITRGTLYFLVGFLAFAVTGVVGTVIGVETGLINYMAKHVPFREKIIEFAKALTVLLRNWRTSLQALAASFVVLAAYFMTFYCAARALGANASLLNMLSIMPVVDVVTALPITVSGLGIREKLFEELMTTLMGVPEEVAILTSLAGFACSAVWSIAGGVLFPLYRPTGAKERPHLLRDLPTGT